MLLLFFLRKYRNITRFGVLSCLTFAEDQVNQNAFLLPCPMTTPSRPISSLNLRALHPMNESLTSSHHASLLRYKLEIILNEMLMNVMMLFPPPI